jgi:putative ABC transport system substrate-binding protein
VTGVSRRLVIKGGLSLATLGLLSGCGAVSRPGQPVSRGPKVSRIGYLTQMTTAAAELEAFRDGLRELGYVEGQNLSVEVRRTETPEQFPALAAELVALPVDLIVTPGGTRDTLAAMSATRTIPVVFTASPDTVRTGFIVSLARPGGNVTGLSTLAPQASGKRLELLRELAPGISRVMFISSTGADATGILLEAEQAAKLLGVDLLAPKVYTVADLPDAFHMAIVDRAEALWTSSSPLLGGEVVRIMEFAMAQRLPVLSQTRTFTDAGGLIYYGSNRLVQFHRAATYVDRILKGANPAEMPVEQPTEFELIINLRTAKALGVTVPRAVLDQATEVIQ